MQLQTIDFHGDALEYITTQEGQRLLPLRRLCEALGLDADGQRKRLADPERCPWACTVVMTVQVAGQGREVFALDLDTLAMWLATIDSSRVDEAARPKVILYQRECARVLRRHFFGEPGAAPTADRLATRQKIVAHLAEALTWAPEYYADGLIRAAGAALKGMQRGGGRPGPAPGRGAIRYAEALAEVLRLRAEGLCHREIAERVGVGQATVSRWLAGVPAWTRAVGTGGQGGAK